MSSVSFLDKSEGVVLYREQREKEFAEEFEAMKRFFPVTQHRTADICRNAVIVPRYCVLPDYRILEEDMRIVGSFLTNTYSQHRYVADISNWYWDLKDITPRTWFRPEDVPDNGGPFIVKGETNSRKHLWDTHMYVETKRDALQAMYRLMDDSLIGHQSIVFREFVPLKTLLHDVRGMPVTEEFRFFVYRRKIISGGYYWSSHVEDLGEEVPSVKNVPVEFLNKVLGLVGDKIPFYVFDVALTESGDWIVIELNDGQQSGLSENDPEVLYSNLKELLRTGKG